MNSSLQRIQVLRFGAEESPPPTLSFAPLVDVVLLLICFYVFVAGSIQNMDDPEVRLPILRTRLLAEKQPSALIINLRADGSIIVNSQSVTRSELADLLRTRGGSGLSATVRVDRGQRFARLDDVLAACREAGLTKILLRTVED